LAAVTFLIVAHNTSRKQSNGDDWHDTAAKIHFADFDQMIVVAVAVAAWTAGALAGFMRF